MKAGGIETDPGNARVSVRPVRINGKNGYDVVVGSPLATAADYIQALDSAITGTPLDRERDPGRERCLGCDLCCRERLPLTSIDVMRMMEAVGERDLYRFLGRYTQVTVSGRAVDITMARDSGACAFLDSAPRQCREYEHRPLACRTFICCPMTQRAESLRDSLINIGEDELVRWWRIEADDKRSQVVHEGSLAGLSGIDVSPTPFNAKESYSQVLLKEVCAAELWRQLSSDTPKRVTRRGRRRG